jgi:membrane protease YdiL (CAAX protease family)
MTLRARVALELGALTAASALFLLAVPERPMTVDAGLGVLALAAVALTARDTRDRVWGPPPAPRPERVRRGCRDVALGTATVVVVFAGAAALLASAAGDPRAIPGRLLQPTLPLALLVFVPWAAVQQTLFQFYLLGRLRALLPGAPPVALAALSGVLFGLVHLPHLDVVAITAIGGAAWSWLYLRDRLLAPLALSHAVLGATHYYWLRGEDLVRRWQAVLG